MADLIARYKPGVNVPAFAKTAVIAGRFVAITDDLTDQGDYQVELCGAGEYAFGVAEADSAADTEPDTSVERRVNVVRRGAIARVLAAGSISAGGPVKSDADGKAIAQAGSGVIVGYACNDCGNGDIVDVDLA